jgi:predicted ATPase/DNA-binding winged helix-turn-helix (wHTH) protein
LRADTIRFDRFELQPPERRLLAAGQPVALGARAFDVLLVLVQRAGSLVSKGELLDTVWAGLVVEEANLTVQVSSLRKVLGGELIATIPGRGYRFTGRIETVSAPAAAPEPATVAGAAPAPPPGPALVGRGAELQRLSAALATPGCVTLVGPSGVGKTRLARAMAAAWAGDAVWVDLAPLTEGAQVLAALARALGQRTPEAAPALLRALGARLLVLDNAEHLIDAVAALVAALHEAAPGLPLLVTCQLPLAVPGERVLRVEPLALGHGVADGEGALALFAERARAADHRFVADAASQPLLQAICSQLDGLPLAIEMAAARVPALGLKGLHEALQQRFAVLTRGARTAAERHRTLHAALDWSHALLQPEEQRVFRALGVFAGGFTLDLAVALAADAGHDRWAVIDTLATLVDRSLVEADAAEPPRYRLLETMRAYALEQLAAAGEQAAARLRHAHALLDLFSAAVASNTAATDGGAAAARAEHDNAREAIAWALQHAPALALRLTPVVCEASIFTSWRTEAIAWLERCAPFADDDSYEAKDRARWWTERARQHLMSGSPEARGMALRARALCHESGSERLGFLAVIVLLRLGGAEATGDPEQDRAAFEALAAEAWALHDAHPERQPRTTVMLHGSLAQACLVRREYERALAHHGDEFAVARRAGFKVTADAAEGNMAAQLFNLGRLEESLARAQVVVERLRGTPDENANLVYAWQTCVGAQTALGRYDEVRAGALAFWRALQRYSAPQLACEWVRLLALEGRHHDAARWVGFLQRASERASAMAISTRIEAVRQARALAGASLDEAAWDAAVAEGREMDEAAAFACLGVNLEQATPA